MDTFRNPGQETTLKRKLTDDLPLFICDDFQPCKYLRVLTENPQPVEKVSDVPRSEGQSQRIAAAPDVVNIQRSAVPSRFMYYDKGEWREYPQDVIRIILEEFVARKGSSEFSILGKEYLVIFVYMLELNVTSGYVRSIAWTDKNGQRFTPPQCIEGSCAQSLSLLQHLAAKDSKVEAKCGDLLKLLQSSQAERTVACNLYKSGCDLARLGDKLIKLSMNDQDFAFAKEKFFNSLPRFPNGATITNIHRNTHSGISGQTRLQAFKLQEGITAEMRGEANVRYAWHGISKKGVWSVILHGFGQPSLEKNSGAYGVGVHLTPENLALSSALNCNVDENGEQHLMLCRVIMGRMERVHAKSRQFHPTNEDYDTGVDDANSPKRYIIWSTHMNTHILPLFIVSFKLPHSIRDVMLAAQRGNQVSKESLTCLWHSTLNEKVFAKSDAMCSAHPPDVQIEQPAESSTGSVSAGDDIKARRPYMSTRSRKICARRCGHVTPRSPWISFVELFPMLESKVKPQALTNLQRLRTDFQVGKLPRNIFVKEVRALLGDELLRDCIKNRTVPNGSTVTFSG